MSQFEPTKIAIVDDHKLIRRAMMELINGFSGYTISLEAGNGKEFIQRLIPDNLPKIVILDISMPIMDGFETATWLQTNFPETKILALSMSKEDDTVIRMLKCGVDGYILKNADPSELRMALEALEANGSYYSSSVSDILKKDLIAPKMTSADLSVSEKEFLKLVCSELPYKSFTPFLKISSRAVEAMRDTLFKKLKVSSRSALVVYAIKHGIYKIE